MSKNNIKSFSSKSVEMYKKYMDPADLLCFYTGVLNIKKPNSFTSHCNDIDIYDDDLSGYDYITNQYDFIHSEYENNEYE